MTFVISVQLLADEVPDDARWPWSVPAVRALRTPLRLDERATILVGENGSGKSTIVEALAVALGMNAEGGSNHMRFSTRTSHSALHDTLRIARTVERPRTRYFLRAESFYNVASVVEQNADAALAHGQQSLHEQSHGESFLSLVFERFGPRGLYLLDEPEAAMSPQGLLTLLQRLHQLADEGSQFVIATHSPILLAFPAAKVVLLDDAGLRPIAWDETEHVRVMRGFLDAPASYLHHLLDPAD
jgi:predicted ATPase